MKKFCFFLLISFLKTNRLLRRGKTVDPETRFLRSCISVGGAIARYLPKPRELQSWFWCICLIVSKMIRSTRKKRQKKKNPELGRHVFKKMVMISFASLFHNRSGDREERVRNLVFLPQFFGILVFVSGASCHRWSCQARYINALALYDPEMQERRDRWGSTVHDNLLLGSISCSFSADVSCFFLLSCIYT